METPYLPKAIFGKDFDNVYEPAEDTFLLLDALQEELDELKKNTSICLECGSGSGTVITALSKSFGVANGASRLMLATDINMYACQTTRKCAKYHDQNGIEVVRTNLADALLDRLSQNVDLLIFNPPYVPTEDDEVEARPESHIYRSWAGGDEGRALIDIFLKKHVPKLLSKPRGVAFMVALDKNNVDELCKHLESDQGIRGSVVMRRKAGVESLFIIKYEWIR